ncbi:MAG: hypothetical protein ACM3PP_13035 [Candidatus Saccharibacteria bacterium]
MINAVDFFCDLLSCSLNTDTTGATSASTRAGGLFFAIVNFDLNLAHFNTSY